MNQKHGYSDFIPAFQEDNRENTLKACRQYMQSHIPEKTPYVRLFSQQLRYISPLFWIWQIIVFLGVMILAAAVPKGEMFAGELLYYTGPLVGILAYPEMFRDLFYDMSEIENSCKNNSATLFVMRLLIVGVMNLLLLTLLAVSFPHSLPTAISASRISHIIIYTSTRTARPKRAYSINGTSLWRLLPATTT